MKSLPELFRPLKVSVTDVQSFAVKSAANFIHAIFIYSKLSVVFLE